MCIRSRAKVANETQIDQFKKDEKTKKKKTQNYLAVKFAFGINILVFVDPHALGCKCNWASHIFFRSNLAKKIKMKKNCLCVCVCESANETRKESKKDGPMISGCTESKEKNRLLNEA